MKIYVLCFTLILLVSAPIEKLQIIGTLIHDVTELNK